MKVLQKMDLIPVLRNSQDSNVKTKTQADFYLKKAFRHYYGQSLLSLTSEFINEDKSLADRMLCGNFIKNLIVEDDLTTSNKQDQWIACETTIKDQIRVKFVEAVGSSTRAINQLALQIILVFGCVDIAADDFSLLLYLIDNLNNCHLSEECKSLSLESLCCLCESLNPSIPESSSIVTNILTACLCDFNATLRTTSHSLLMKLVDVYRASLPLSLVSQLILSNKTTATTTAVVPNSKLSDIYKLFLKGDCFLPDYVELLIDTKVIFRNEDKLTHIIQCKGNLTFPALSIASHSEKCFTFTLPGRYELSGVNIAAMRCIVEVKAPEVQSTHRVVYFPTAKDKVSQPSVTVNNKENNIAALNDDEELPLSGATQQKASKKRINANNNINSNADGKSNQVIRVNSSDSEDHRNNATNWPDIAALTSHRMKKYGKLPKTSLESNNNNYDEVSGSSSDEEGGNVILQRQKMKAAHHHNPHSHSSNHHSSKNTANGSQHNSNNNIGDVNGVKVKNDKRVSVVTSNVKANKQHNNINNNKTNNSKPSSTAVTEMNSTIPKRTIRLWIQDYTFNTEQVTVFVNQTIEFNLAMDVPNHAEHHLIGTSSNPELKFESPLLQQGNAATFIFVPKVAGEVLVSCAIYSDMHCLITVINSNGAAAASTSTNNIRNIPNHSEGSVSFVSSEAHNNRRAATPEKNYQQTGCFESPADNINSNNNNNGSNNSSAEKLMHESGLAIHSVKVSTVDKRSGDVSESGQSSFYDSDDVFSDELNDNDNEDNEDNALVSKQQCSNGVTPQRLLYGTVDVGAVVVDGTTKAGVKRHFINVEEFRFSPSTIVIRVNEEVLLRKIDTNTGNSSYSSTPSIATISCEGEFEGIRLQSSPHTSTSLSTTTSNRNDKSNSSGSSSACSYFVHQFTRPGAYEIKSDIFQFMGCQVLVSALEFATSQPSHNNNNNNNTATSVNAYKSTTAPRLMGSFTRLNNANVSNNTINTAAAGPHSPPTPIFNKPIDRDNSSSKPSTSPSVVNNLQEDSPQRSVNATSSGATLSPVAVKVMMASADFTCELLSSDDEEVEHVSEVKADKIITATESTNLGTDQVRKGFNEALSLKQATPDAKVVVEHLVSSFVSDILDDSPLVNSTGSRPSVVPELVMSPVMEEAPITSIPSTAAVSRDSVDVDDGIVAATTAASDGVVTTSKKKKGKKKKKSAASTVASPTTNNNNTTSSAVDNNNSVIDNEAMNDNDIDNGAREASIEATVSEDIPMDVCEDNSELVNKTENSNETANDITVRDIIHTINSSSSSNVVPEAENIPTETIEKVSAAEVVSSVKEAVVGVVKLTDNQKKQLKKKIKKAEKAAAALEANEANSNSRSSKKSTTSVGAGSVGVKGKQVKSNTSAEYPFTENECDQSIVDYLRRKMQLLDGLKEDKLPSGKRVKVIRLRVKAV